ncbi:alpha/beta hydrolase [Shewanella sp. Choline-02u-19]|jgi:lysophospholipase|uniref:alpha/beta fold hydrolase n=1 Tax=unclassified Shewanella TaxID=196818 RepID=UPI000C3418D0|nr:MULTISPECIES: alpha/beta fold hydrolase [unclassified Shewanella]PKG57469.1 alpha/beta hydrolase [Shewanella sp. GutDb-MelDb]PKG72954.1 alpha/beta hydrolase [Shewanella sp. GutCb]PKH58275.1 alpha/beta hydrolase [Shewanella sp. Bg11-22]PKI29461.1 alpha/beta hydrolase [Shewanella sp. Choline-02u-19]
MPNAAEPAISLSSVCTFSSEHHLSSPEQAAFWQQVTQASFKTKDGISLAYASVIQQNSKGTIVLSSGRVESYLKYKELMFDLYRQGYDLFAIDHRGQGLSSRTTVNLHQGHIDKFQRYVDDFDEFIYNIVKPVQERDYFLVGHSMGGAIGTLYLAQHPGVFKSAVFSAPMYGIKLPLPKRFIRKLASLLDNHSNQNPNYVLGGKDYHADPFEKNDLTNSKLRYDDYRDLYQQQPKLQLGSPTNRWLVESIDAGESAIKAAQNINIPLLILQAEEDTIVSNAAQKRASTGFCKLIKIPYARHEIFMERDTARNTALTALLNFIQV